MLSGEGNENGEKTTIYRCRVISKKATLDAQHTFFNLCHCFVRLQRETSRNFLVTCFMEKMSYMFLFSFFFTAAHFHLGDRQHFSFSHHCYKIFMLFFHQKVCPLFFISRANSLSLFFSSSFAGLSPTLSFSLSFSCSIFQICRHDN